MVEDKVKVLIVDDDKMICDVLENDLSGRGYECTSAQTGEDALTELRLKKYDVVLLDIRLHRDIWSGGPNVYMATSQRYRYYYDNRSQ